MYRCECRPARMACIIHCPSPHRKKNVFCGVRHNHIRLSPHLCWLVMHQTAMPILLNIAGQVHSSNWIDNGHAEIDWIYTFDVHLYIRILWIIIILSSIVNWWPIQMWIPSTHWIAIYIQLSEQITLLNIVLQREATEYKVWQNVKKIWPICNRDIYSGVEAECAW